jgi:hypothetical protein
VARGERELGRTEDGAVLAITALLVAALLGMTVLVTDVGVLLYRRVELQNAADAAALAAALSCGQRAGRSHADASAAELAADNSAIAGIEAGYPRYTPSCDAPAGTVTVRVRGEQHLFFGPVLGADAASVRAEATARWGGAGATQHTAPLMLSARRLSDCDVPPADPNVVRECAFYWDNSPASATDPALTNAEWGTLDLNKWDVVGTDPPGPIERCDNSTPPEFSRWMFEGFDGLLNVNGPDGTGVDPPTYVCRGQGNFGASLDNLIQRAIREGLDLYFPVSDPRGQVDKDGNPCIPPDLMEDPSAYDGCTVDKYDIIGFARLRIVALYKKQDRQTVELCTSRIPGATPDANARCMVVRWVGYTPEGLQPVEGENFGLVPVELIA